MRRDNLISLLNQYGMVGQKNESPQNTYLDEDERREWRKYLEDKIYQTFRETIVSSSPDPYTVINSRFKCSFDRLFFSKENPCVIGEIIKETDTEPEDVDLEEFEKVLNGGGL